MEDGVFGMWWGFRWGVQVLVLNLRVPSSARCLESSMGSAWCIMRSIRLLGLSVWGLGTKCKIWGGAGWAYHCVQLGHDMNVFQYRGWDMLLHSI